jgi:excinuclease ABC subunit A
MASDSMTAQYLRRTRTSRAPTATQGQWPFGAERCQGNNLRRRWTSFPLGTFICITGVSGSGKSTLIGDTLYPILSKTFHRSDTAAPALQEHRRPEAHRQGDRGGPIPIGRTPRSNPATYTGLFDHIRLSCSPNLPSAKIRGYKTGRFSFNTPGGRCETCKGSACAPSK